jgi:hypothetical protein
MYYIGMVVHSADHFLVDQLSVIVQLAKTLGNQNIFVSMLDYHSSDSTETLVDLCEAVLILLGVPYRIRRVPSMTVDPGQAYYPAEEAYMRNLALEPLKELYVKRKIKFHRVIWLKGFTCPNDILENIKVSIVNDAAMVCGMDWSEYNGFYIFSDRCVALAFEVLEAKSPDRCTVGELGTSAETSFVKPSRLPNPMPDPHAIPKALSATPSIFRFKSFAASLARTSSTRRSLTITTSCTGLAQTTTTPPWTRPAQACRNANPGRRVLIALKPGSAVTFGSTRPRLALSERASWRQRLTSGLGLWSAVPNQRLIPLRSATSRHRVCPVQKTTTPMLVPSTTQ